MSRSRELALLTLPGRFLDLVCRLPEPPQTYRRDPIESVDDGLAWLREQSWTLDGDGKRRRCVKWWLLLRRQWDQEHAHER